MTKQPEERDNKSTNVGQQGNKSGQSGQPGQQQQTNTDRGQQGGGSGKTGQPQHSGSNR